MNAITRLRRQVGRIGSQRSGEPSGFKIWGTSKLSGTSYAELFRLPLYTMPVMADGGTSTEYGPQTTEGSPYQPRFVLGQGYLEDAPW